MAKRRGFPRLFYVPELTAHIHIAAAAVVVIWCEIIAAAAVTAMNPDDYDGDYDDNPESFIVVAENAVVVAADIVARVVAAAVIITIHHSKYLRLKIKFTLHTIRNADFCYCISPRAGRSASISASCDILCVNWNNVHYCGKIKKAPLRKPFSLVLIT